MNQFVGSSFVRLFENGFDLKLVMATSGHQSGIRLGTIANIGVYDAVRLAEVHHILSCLIALQAGKDAPAEL